MLFRSGVAEWDWVDKISPGPDILPVDNAYACLEAEAMAEAGVRAGVSEGPRCCPWVSRSQIPFYQLEIRSLNGVRQEA